jgi:hypothetical protein
MARPRRLLPPPLPGHISMHSLHRCLGPTFLTPKNLWKRQTSCGSLIPSILRRGQPSSGFLRVSLTPAAAPCPQLCTHVTPSLSRQLNTQAKEWLDTGRLCVCSADSAPRSLRTTSWPPPVGPGRHRDRSQLAALGAPAGPVGGAYSDVLRRTLSCRPRTLPVSRIHDQTFIHHVGYFLLLCTAESGLHCTALHCRVCRGCKELSSLATIQSKYRVFTI